MTVLFPLFITFGAGWRGADYTLLQPESGLGTRLIIRDMDDEGPGSGEMVVLNGIHQFDTEDETDKTNEEDLQLSRPARPTLYHFGCGAFHPGWLQVLADPKVYTFVLCLFGVVEGATVSGETAYLYLPCVTCSLWMSVTHSDIFATHNI